MTDIFVDNHQYMVCSPDGAGLDPQNARINGTGFVEASDTTAIVFTGTDTGPVRVDAEILTDAPPPNAAMWMAQGWDAVAEVSLYTPDGSFATVSTTVGKDGPLTVTAGPPGTYRLRVHAAGRDQASRSLTLEEPLETHRIAIWPAPAAPIAVLRSADEFGAVMGRTE